MIAKPPFDSGTESLRSPSSEKGEPEDDWDIGHCSERPLGGRDNRTGNLGIPNLRVDRTQIDSQCAVPGEVVRPGSLGLRVVVSCIQSPIEVKET